MNDHNQVIGVWRSDLPPSAADALGISVNTKLLKAGDYLLTLDGRTHEGRYVAMAKYRFRATTTK